MMDPVSLAFGSLFLAMLVRFSVARCCCYPDIDCVTACNGDVAPGRIQVDLAGVVNDTCGAPCQNYNATFITVPDTLGRQCSVASGPVCTYRYVIMVGNAWCARGVNQINCYVHDVIGDNVYWRVEGVHIVTVTNTCHFQYYYDSGSGSGMDCTASRSLTALFNSLPGCDDTAMTVDIVPL